MTRENPKDDREDSVILRRETFHGLAVRKDWTLAVRPLRTHGGEIVGFEVLAHPPGHREGGGA